MKLFTLFFLALALAPSASSEPLVADAYFAAAPKRRVPITSKPDFSIGPLNQVGDAVYFSRRLVGTYPCAGKFLYRIPISGGVAFTQVATFECITEVLSLPGNRLGVRVFEKDAWQTLVFEAEQWRPLLAPAETNETLGAELFVSFFDLGSDLLGAKIGRHIPYSFGPWSLAWAAGAEGRTVAVSGYDPILDSYRPRRISDLPQTALDRSVLSSGGELLYVPIQGDGFAELQVIGLADGGGDEKLGKSPAQPPSETLVPADNWSALEISSLRAAFAGGGLWLSDHSSDSKAPSRLWHYDPKQKQFALLADPPMVDWVSFQPVADGLLVGRENGAIELLTTKKGTAPKAARPPTIQSLCQFQIRAVETPRGREWVFGLPDTDGHGFTSLVQTEVIARGWYCQKDLLVLVAARYLLMAHEGHLQIDVRPEAGGHSLESNIARILDWSGRFASERIALAEQEKYFVEPAQKTLLLFEGSRLKKALSAFPGTEFGDLVGDLTDASGVSVLALSASDKTPLRYRYRFHTKNKILMGEEP